MNIRNKLKKLVESHTNSNKEKRQIINEKLNEVKKPNKKPYQQ